MSTAMALVLPVSLPLSLRATPQTPSGDTLTAREVRKAEADAKTAADHIRLAAFYQSKALRIQHDLAEAEDLVNYWSQQYRVAGRTKVPNPYTVARSRAERYRSELKKTSKLAADHQRTAESLQARPPQ